ncbi:MAG: HPF/RaiA family ribosome-associated protein [bacterium]
MRKINMQVPLKITFRGISKTKSLETLINEEVGKLKKVCGYIISFHIAIERAQGHHETGNPCRIRIDVRVPPGHELVAKYESPRGNIHEELTHDVKQAFQAMLHQLKKLVEEQSREVKAHPAQEVNGIIRKIFKEKGYGFIQALDEDSCDIYFHQNSVLNKDFVNLEIGTGVHYVAEMGENGLQATSVHVING